MKTHSEVLNPLQVRNDGIESSERKTNDNILNIENSSNIENYISNGEKNNFNQHELCSERTANKWCSVHAGYSDFLSKSLEMSR